MDENVSLYTDRKDISRPIRCETCTDGLAFGNNVHCHRCLDEFFWGPVTADGEELCDAARIRIVRWYDADEVIRLSKGERDLNHRFEGVVCRRLQEILESDVDVVEKARLVLDIDVIASDIEFEHSYNISARSIHKAHVEFGQLLRAELPAKPSK